jgi:transposase-like protein
MTHLNQLQTLKIICPSCGQKHLKTIGSLAEHQSIDCNCGVETTCNDIQSLVNQAVEELK